MMSYRWVPLAFVGVGAVAMSAAAQPSGFWLMGYPEGGTYSVVRAVSQDGSVAVGTSEYDTIDKLPGFRWTSIGGRDDWGLLPGMPKYTPVAATDSAGNTMVGWTITTSIYRAFRRVGNGPIEDLGVLPGQTRSFANGVSGDGTIVVGYSESGPNSYQYGEAFRWTAAKGMQGLGKLTPQSDLSDARAISRDGSTIVGFNENEVLWFQAFVWTEAGGMKALPTLTGAPSDSEARAVNADGTVVVGSSTSLMGNSHAARWVNGQPMDLASPTKPNNSLAFSVSDDGSVVGGAYQQGASSLAFIWSEPTGMLDAKDYLAPHGITMPPGYKLEYVFAIAGDGLTFGGLARNLSTNIKEGFVATIKGKVCVADCDASGLLDIDDFICFQTRFAISDPYADCDASGSLDIDDFICFQTLFAVGCQG